MNSIGLAVAAMEPPATIAGDRSDFVHDSALFDAVTSHGLRIGKALQVDQPIGYLALGDNIAVIDSDARCRWSAAKIVRRGPRR